MQHAIFWRDFASSFNQTNTLKLLLVRSELGVGDRSFALAPCLIGWKTGVNPESWDPDPPWKLGSSTRSPSVKAFIGREVDSFLVSLGGNASFTLCFVVFLFGHGFEVFCPRMSSCFNFFKACITWAFASRLSLFLVAISSMTLSSARLGLNWSIKQSVSDARSFWISQWVNVVKGQVRLKDQGLQAACFHAGRQIGVVSPCRWTTRPRCLLQL